MQKFRRKFTNTVIIWIYFPPLFLPSHTPSPTHPHTHSQCRCFNRIFIFPGTSVNDIVGGTCKALNIHCISNAAEKPVFKMFLSALMPTKSLSLILSLSPHPIPAGVFALSNLFRAPYNYSCDRFEKYKVHYAHSSSETGWRAVLPCKWLCAGASALSNSDIRLCTVYEASPFPCKLKPTTIC